MVNVTKDNFIEQSNDFLKHLPTAAFIAIDEEMTGISLPASKSSTCRAAAKDETPGQRYAAELKQIPERYSIIQFGITLFHSTATDPVVAASSAAAAARNGNGPNSAVVEWKARRYNFYMFPNEKSSRGDVVLNPGAVHFLNQHNMSFDEWTKKGINFCTQDEARDLLKLYVIATRQAKEQVAAEDDANTRPPTLQDASRPRIELRRTEDIDFFSRTMASVREWLDAALPQHHQHIRLNHPGAPQQQQQQHFEGTSLLLPECSAFMRRALYESIQQEYPSLVLENASENGNGGNRNQIRVWRLNEQEKAQRRLRLQRQAWENLILHKIGMTRIFAALTRVCSGLPLDRHSVLFAPSMDQVVVASDGCDGDLSWDEDQVVAAASFVPNSPMQKQQYGRKIPIVVHNGFMDLCFLMTHFCQHELPATLTECKALIRHHFPIVYDTKILSTETYAASSLSDSSSGTLMLGTITNTRLDGLFDRYGRLGGLQNAVQVVSSSSTNNHSRAAAPAVDDDQEHEAAYDAYMTGVCFIGLIRDIQHGIQLPLPGSADYHEDDESVDNDDHNHDEEGDDGSEDHGNNDDHDDDYNDDDDEEEGELDVSTIETETQKLVRVILSKDETAKVKNRNSNHDVRALFGRNKLFQISMYTMDLEEPIRDPLSRGMLGEAAFRVSGFDPSVSTRDIVRCLLGLVDSRGRRVNFELIWIDDTTIVVAACWRPPPPSSVVAAAANGRAAGLAAAAAAALAAARGGGIGGAAAAAAANQNHGNASSRESEDSTTILREHGQIVYDTLTTRFSRDMIVNLNDYLDSLEAAASVASAESGKDASAAASWTSRIWGMFGYKKKKASAEDNENAQDARSNKRRRLG